jgi:sugar lactone lactonase YvrE
VLAELEPVYPNGIVAEPDGSIVWVESYTLMVRRRRPDGTIEDLCRLPDGHIPDGFKIAANGDFWITAFSSGSIDIVSSEGELRDAIQTDVVPLNCVFDGRGNLYVCDFGTANTSGASMGGRLLKIEVDEQGMQLFRGALG